ncbi:hypothetical protein [Dongia sp.]|uniref:hypothetical protein n=1 Tax=Dongia sp. TaxID=1977262 RepID=UPI003753C635
MSNRLVAQSRPFSNARIERTFEQGLTIMEMMEQSDIDMKLAYRIGRVWISDPVSGAMAEIHSDTWHVVRPKAGMGLTLSLEPGKKKRGGGKSIFGLVLSIAVMAAAAWAGPYLAGPGLLGLSGFGGSLVGGVITGVIGRPGKLYIGGSIA